MYHSVTWPRCAIFTCSLDVEYNIDNNLVGQPATPGLYRVDKDKVKLTAVSCARTDRERSIMRGSLDRQLCTAQKCFCARSP